jgi:16S rRNA processing protein RimM
VGPAHGLDGSFRVVAPVPQLLSLGGTVTIGGEQRVIDRLAGHDRRVILRIEGVSDRNGAEALHGAELLVDRSLAPPLEQDEWWATDLEGCLVRDGERTVGVVKALLALPSCELLSVERDDGSGELLVPLVSDAVRSVDIDRNEIDINLQFLGEE